MYFSSQIKCLGIRFDSYSRMYFFIASKWCLRITCLDGIKYDIVEDNTKSNQWLHLDDIEKDIADVHYEETYVHMKVPLKVMSHAHHGDLTASLTLKSS